MNDDKEIKRQEIIGSVSMFIESYIFSLIAFFLSYNNIRKIIPNWNNIVNIFKSLSSLAVDQVPFLSQMIVTAILAFVNATVGFLLIIREKPLQKPKGFLEIFIPTISTYFWITYNAIPYLPKEVNFYLVPMNTLLFFSFTGSIIVIAGCIISAIAVFNLRRSFSVIIQVRNIVKHGLYRYVRHPMYFGYVITAIGLSMTSPQFFFIFLTSIHVILLFFRAYLEEKKLAACSGEYRKYMQNTPFLFPVKFKKLT
jgi:isoprenylcysteine carboxyl methyltransferase (ICMT) family protein YpbQ